ncbi:MAG TPA: methionyl-tRNA formyltransferase [Chthoniobacterales bacterium]|jgi:methionyl-tRNA formyltransferase|nr:methionyl-tRNA formyltransferase [Chthoniobacterales bacterium]
MRIVFIGTGEIGVPSLRALQNSGHELVAVVTQPDKPAGREQKITAPPIKAALAGSKISILQPEKIKHPEAIEQIRALAPDLIVVMAYGQILPRDVLEIPKIACLNLHASLLSRWRGAAPIQAAIAAGDVETGITVMYMNEGLDTGDILLQRKIDIAPNETGGSLHDRLAGLAPDSLLDALNMFPNAPRTPQDNVLATYASKLNRESGRIDWNEPAQVIERKIRAYNPWPGAFTEFNNRKLKVFAASIVDLRGKPGEILRKEKELVFGTGDRALSLTEIQLEGKRRMSAPDFLRGAVTSS